MEGLLGLTKSINTTESAVRDLSVLERMDQRVQQDRQSEVQAQQQEQLMYERAYQMSDQLLEKDRNRINKRLKMAQNQITDQMRLNGGSKKRFMEKGGLSFINGVTSDIMRSPEAVQYQENKKNLAKIIEAKEKGFGHLLSPKDLKSLEDYEKNEDGGLITYSGIMAEVEIPPSENFDYGTDIPMEKILSHGSNMMKVKGNFEMVYPNKEPNYANIVAFAKEMGYGGTGSNQTRMRMEMQTRMARAQAAATKPTKQEVHENSYISLFNTFKANSLPKGLNMQMLEEKYQGGLIEELRKSNTQTNKLIADKSNLTSRKRSLSEDGLDWTDIRDNIPGAPNSSEGETAWEWAFNEKYGLKESYQFMPLGRNMIVNRVLGDHDKGGAGYKIENNKILEFVPSEDMFRMDGVQVSGSHKLDAEDHKGNYIVEGVVTALKGKGQDGDMLLMNAYDDDGVTIDKKQTESINEGYRGKNGGDELGFTTVIALRNEKTGDLFYKEVDISRPDIAQALSNAVGDDDNIQPQVDQDNRDAATLANIKAMARDEEIKVRGTMNTLEQGVFQDGAFEMEGEKFYGANSAGQLNRYPLMKSFYSALDYVSNSNVRNDNFPNGNPSINPQTVQKAIDNRMFTTFAQIGGIEEDLRKYEQGNSDVGMVQKWLSNVNQGLDPNSYDAQVHNEIASKWVQMLKLQNK